MDSGPRLDLHSQSYCGPRYAPHTCFSDLVWHREQQRRGGQHRQVGPTLTHTRRQVPQCWASCSSCPGTKGHQGGRGQGQADIQGPAWDPKSCSPRSGLRKLAGLDQAGRDHHSAILSNCFSGTPNSGNVLSRAVRSLPRWGSLAPTPPCDFSTPKGEKGLSVPEEKHKPLTQRLSLLLKVQ